MIKSLRRWLASLAAVCILPLAAGPAFAGTETDETDKENKSVPEAILGKVTPLNTLEIDSSYVGESSFKEKEFRGSNSPGGVQHSYRGIDELENSIEYGHRFHLFGKVFLKLGVDYERFDFGTTDAPLPSSLQNISGVVAVEYIEQGTPAAFITMKPGVYFSDNQIRPGDFDIPTNIGSAFKFPYFKNIYGLAGVRVSLLAKYPVMPIVGVVWLINDHLRLDAVPPEPRLIASINKHLDLFVGGELLGEAYKRDVNNDYRPQFRRFSGAVIDYSEQRVGSGLTYKVNKVLDIDLSGGWDLGRKFDYYRGTAPARFVTHGAPYAKVEVSAEF